MAIEPAAMTPCDADIIIVGAGPAGLALTRALSGNGLRIMLIERQAADVLADPADDGREIALTHRSVATLTRLGAWRHLTSEHIAPMRAARVIDGQRPFALSFAPDGTEAQLGCLVSNHHIRRALFAAISGQANVDLVAGTGVSTTRTDTQAARVRLNDGRELTARLLVAADSRFSAVRDQLGIAARINRLGKAMLVTRVAHDEVAHDAIATEWFDHGQTLAFLPLHGARSSLVLTLPTAQVEALAALPAQALGAELTRLSGARMGRLRVEGGAHVYPLATTWSRHFAATRAALIGDAAVGMHPVTAHGFNLGLRSADKLATLITQAQRHGRDIAAPLLLRRYEAAHRVASRPIYDATALIVGLYTDDTAPARIIRQGALHLAAGMPYFRQGLSRVLMRH